MQNNSLAVLLLLAPGLAFGQPAQRTFKIPDATALRLSLTEPLSSATNNVDDPVRFEVTEDVKVGGVIVIPRGSTAIGHVVEVEPRRRMGRAGKLNFALDHVKALDESNVRLRASSTRKGDDKTGTVIVGTVLLSPLFLIMRGKDIEIPKGMSITAYVDGDREITIPDSGGSAAARLRGDSELASESKATLSFKSDPDGADVSIDGKYAGNTPSNIQLEAGDHTIVFEKSGFRPWQRTVTVNGGSSINISATLDKISATLDKK